MNIDQFKSLLISTTAQAGLSWNESDNHEPGRALLQCSFVLPRYEDECNLQLMITENTIEISFILDRLVPSFDNLKLINDFNTHVPFANAFIERIGKDRTPFLVLRAALFNPRDEQQGLDYFNNTLNYIFDDSVATYLRPLTVITD